MSADQGSIHLDLIYGLKKLEPVKWTRRVERIGFFQWRWVIECEHSQMSCEPFLTRRSAERDMARYPV